MGSTSYTPPAIETVVDGKTVTKRKSLKKDISGNLVTFEEFVEDENGSVTDRVVNSTVFTTTIQTTAAQERGNRGVCLHTLPMENQSYENS